MFGIPGEVFWPTVAFGAIILLVFGGIALLRFLPHRPEREALEELRVRLAELDRLQERISDLEERLDFAERILAKQRENERLGPPQD